MQLPQYWPDRSKYVETEALVCNIDSVASLFFLIRSTLDFTLLTLWNGLFLINRYTRFMIDFLWFSLINPFGRKRLSRNCIFLTILVESRVWLPMKPILIEKYSINSISILQVYLSATQWILPLWLPLPVELKNEFRSVSVCKNGQSTNPKAVETKKNRRFSWLSSSHLYVHGSYWCLSLFAVNRFRLGGNRQSFFKYVVLFR